MDSAPLSEEEMQAIERNAIPDTTTKATIAGVKKFQLWRNKRRIDINFVTVKATELNNILRQFYAEIRAINGNRLSPSSLVGIRAAINRHVRGTPLHREDINVVAGPEFLSANKMFEAVCKLYYKEGNAKPQHKAVIEETDLKKLGIYFKGWSSNPVVLVDAVWFTLCYHFGRRGREGWMQLTKNSFVVRLDENNDKYITTNKTETTKNMQGGYKQRDQDYSDNRVSGEAVEMFEFYLSKLHPELDRLFQYPLPAFTGNNQTWFSKHAIGKNTLANMMQRISKKANLSKNYTCHCVRASTITTLFRAGVSPQNIMAITKHKNVSSLNHYIGEMSNAQKKDCSNILSGSLRHPTFSTEVANLNAFRNLSCSTNTNASNNVNPQNFAFDQQFVEGQGTVHPPIYYSNCNVVHHHNYLPPHPQQRRRIIIDSDDE